MMTEFFALARLYLPSYQQLAACNRHLGSRVTSPWIPAFFEDTSLRANYIAASRIAASRSCGNKCAKKLER